MTSNPDFQAIGKNLERAGINPEDPFAMAFASLAVGVRAGSIAEEWERTQRIPDGVPEGLSSESLMKGWELATAAQSWIRRHSGPHFVEAAVEMLTEKTPASDRKHEFRGWLEGMMLETIALDDRLQRLFESALQGTHGPGLEQTLASMARIRIADIGASDPGPVHTHAGSYKKFTALSVISRAGLGSRLLRKVLRDEMLRDETGRWLRVYDREVADLRNLTDCLLASCRETRRPKLENLYAPYGRDIAECLERAGRIVVKVGSQTLCDVRDGCARLDQRRLRDLVGVIADLHRHGKEIILVSSGAGALGREVLGVGADYDPRQKHLHASVGQPELISLYKDLFAEYGIVISQFLVTDREYSTERDIRTIRRRLDTLLNDRVVPVFNINDGVYEGDAPNNDQLGGVVAVTMNADALATLSDVSGVFSENPGTNHNAELVRFIDSKEALGSVNLDGQSELGAGGMAAKVWMNSNVAKAGVPCFILSGRDPHLLYQMFILDRFEGTYFPAKRTDYGAWLRKQPLTSPEGE